jgi:hypothetical protein
MPNQHLDTFGKFLIENLWDRAIHHHLLMERCHWKAPALQIVQSQLNATPPEVKQLIRECVAQALLTATHDFLFALQEAHDLNKRIEVNVDGQNIAAVSDGLQGELFTEDGWIARFSHAPKDWPDKS